jgi:hypothetical protein
MLVDEAVQYGLANEQVKLWEARKELVRLDVELAVAENGELDQDGHKHVMDFSKEGVEVKHQRRASIRFNEALAEQILRKKHLYELCVREEIVVTHVIDTDKIEEAYQAGKISQREFDAMFTESVNWALYVDVNPTVFPQFGEVAEARKALEKQAKEAKAQRETALEKYKG